MERKKVESNITLNKTPKKREDYIIKDNTPLSNWKKVKGVTGKIVRYKQSEDKKRIEELSKKKYRQMYVGIDNGNLYFYYEIFE